MTQQHAMIKYNWHHYYQVLQVKKSGSHQNLNFIHATALEEAQYKLKLSTRITDTTLVFFQFTVLDRAQLTPQ